MDLVGFHLGRKNEALLLERSSVQQSNKIFTDLSGPSEVQQNITSVVSPGRLQSMELASS